MTPTTTATAKAVEAAQVSADWTTSPSAESSVSTSFENRFVRRPWGCASKKAMGSRSTRRSMRECRAEAARREPRTVAAARAAFERVVIPFAARFRPEAIVVSAGFDAHELEPLAGLRWTDATYQFLGAATARLAGRHGCGLLFVLEGGYSRRALRSAVAALAKGAATLEEGPPAVAPERGEREEREVEAAIRAVVEEHKL